VRDFTLKKYELLLKTIKRIDYPISTILNFLTKPPGKCIILRQDVDCAVNRDLGMAKLEHRHVIAYKVI
jgi:hypothetical protein